MTLVIGIVHKEGIVIAADSQATMQLGVPAKKLNPTKLI